MSEKNDDSFVGQMCMVRGFNVAGFPDEWVGPVRVTRFWDSGDGYNWSTENSLGDRSGWYREVRLADP